MSEAVGKPLTDQPRHAGRLLRPREQRRLQENDTIAPQELLDRMVGVENVLRALTGIIATKERRVLWSGSALINSNGIWHRRLPQGSKAIFVMNFSGNSTVTVAAGAPLGAAPGPGAGTHNVPAGVAAVFNDDTADWTLYGSSGNALDVQIFSIPITPMASGEI